MSKHIWYNSPRSPGFFSQSANRRDFMERLEQELEIREPEDWYVLTRRMVVDLGGDGVLKYYGNSIIAMLEDHWPPYDWKEWLFPRVPPGFWQKSENCRRYLEWLGEQLGYVEPEDWYQLHALDLSANRGASLLDRHRRSPSRVVMTYFPEHEWLEWRFENTPCYFWDDSRNRRRYLDWLGKRLGYKKPEDWYQLTGNHLITNYGTTLFRRFGCNSCHVVMAHFPEYEWLDWKFAKVPTGFWNDIANCRRYLDWLAEQLGVQEPRDWCRVPPKTFGRYHGATLFQVYGSRHAMLQACFPEHEFHEWFSESAHDFWSDSRNCNRYLDWLGRELGFEEPQDWYRLTYSSLADNFGRTLGKRFGWRIVDIVRFHLPEHDWLEWLFQKAPAGFWDDPVNRCRYMDWLGGQLSFKEPEDWYQLKMRHLNDNRGIRLYDRFGGSIVEILKDYMPKYDWKEWLFARSPKGFWKMRANRQRYIKWLGERLDCERPEDWLRVKNEDFRRNHGATLLDIYDYSIQNILSDSLGPSGRAPSASRPPARRPPPSPRAGSPRRRTNVG